MDTFAADVLCDCTCLVVYVQVLYEKKCFNDEYMRLKKYKPMRFHSYIINSYIILHIE